MTEEKGFLWKKDKVYLFFRPYVDWCTRTSYAPFVTRGKENIPEEGPVIIACNHCNTLMDALVVLQARRQATAFGARADMFRNPTAASILHWLRIVPLARHRDTPEEIARNAETFELINECICRGTPFAIYPEGTHRMKRSLLPLKKGIAKMALMTNEKYGVPVSIVPAGIDYYDYLHNMVPATLTFGKPIVVNAGDEIPDILEKLRAEMSKLITYFPDDENYDKAFAEWEKENRKPHKGFLHTLRNVLLTPLFAVSAVLSAPMWITSAFICRKLKDKAWSNTVRFGTKLIGIILLTIIYGILGFVFLPWWGALALIVATWFSHQTFYWILNSYKGIL